MAKCFCVHYEDEVELFLDVESGEYQFVSNNDNRTPLHWAAATGQSQTVSTLLELNANPAPVDVEGATPLEYARQANHQECIQILEDRLGFNATSNGNFNISNTNIGNNESLEQNKGRKNPLGFIVDFFRPKKAKNNHMEVSDESQVTYNESDSSTSGYNINNRNLNQRTRLGAGSPNLQQNNSEEVRLSTPRRQKESEVIKSIEKLHVSRTDNPVLLHRTPVKHPDHLPIASPISSSNLQTSSNSSSSEADSSIDHSMLIRSPPPMMKHEGSLSPPLPGAGTGVGPGWGRDHARLEEDAAQILAIHDTRWSNYGSTTSLTTSKSLTPLPAISSRDCASSEFNMNAQDSTSHHSSLHQPKPHSLQLAPLKGPIPQLNNHTALRSPVNKTLESIRKIPTSGPSRSSTSPARPSASANSSHLSSHSPSASPGNRAHTGANSQRKKKKKKKTQNTESSMNVEDSENWTANVDSVST